VYSERTTASRAVERGGSGASDGDPLRSLPPKYCFLSCRLAGKQDRYSSATAIWIAANGAFMDCAILEWCKLFAEPKGKHRWSRSVADKTAFAAALYRRLRLTESDFSAYIKTFKHRETNSSRTLTSCT